MTRTQKRTLRSCLYSFVTLALLIGICVSYTMFSNTIFDASGGLKPDLIQASRKMNLLIYAGVAYWVVLGVLNHIKTKVVLTESERAEKRTTAISLDNRFNPWRFVGSLVILFSVLIVILFPALHAVSKDYGWQKTLVSLFHIMNHLYWFVWIGLGLGVVLITLFSLKSVHNTYRIEGESLHICEYSFRRLETEMRIPISAIQEVALKGQYGRRPCVVLTIDGLRRELQCTTHAEQLAVEIQKELAD